MNNLKLSLLLISLFFVLISFSGCEIVHLNDIAATSPKSAADIVILPPQTDTNTEQASETTVETAPPIDPNNPEYDILKDINPSELDLIDYSGAVVEYLSGGGFGLETDGEMPKEDAKNLFEVLSAAEISSTSEYIEPWTLPSGENIRKFRITLNTNEKIHIGFDLSKFSDTLIFINNNFYRCDTKSLVKLEKLRKTDSFFIIDPDSDPIIDVKPSDLKSIDFSDADIRVLWSRYDLTEYCYGLYNNQLELFLQHLKNASISSVIDSSYVWREEDNYNDFRIVLSTGDIIYIGFDTSYCNDIFINGDPYKCDRETLEKLEEYAIKSHML